MFINIESESERLRAETQGKCRPIVPEELVRKDLFTPSYWEHECDGMANANLALLKNG